MASHRKGSNPEPSQPTSPDIWAEDPYYDGPKGNRSVAIWAVALSVVIAGGFGSLGYMFGMGSNDGQPERIYSTITSEATVTEEVTHKSQKIITKTPEPKISVRLVPTPGPTIFRTRTPKPAPTVTKTRTITQDPKTLCFDVDMIAIDCPADTHTGPEDESP